MADDSSVRETIELEAAPERVWELLMDPRRLGEWVSAHRKLDELPRLPLESGDRFRQKLGIGPVSFWVEWSVVEARAPELARWRGDGPGNSRAVVTYRLTAAGDGTRFEYENDYEPPGGRLGHAAKRVVNAAAGHREARKSLRRLAAVLDGDG